MNAEISYNLDKVLGTLQKRFLWKWFIQRVIFVSFPALFVAVGLEGIWRWAFGTVFIFSIISFVWRYGLDLWYNKPSVTYGHLTKFSKRIRGPRHYYILINDIQIRVPKEVWLTVEEKKGYEVYYSPRSKWLMSYRESTLA
ncbi:MAG: hypothetical protein H6641_07560 [Caldilineaceae bacterium]|nr:hypothetical protein [Caldilineaceae bacterium]